MPPEISKTGLKYLNFYVEFFLHFYEDIRKLNEKDLREVFDIYKVDRRLPLVRPNCFAFPAIEDEERRY